jgi:hypothetical protein
MPAASRLWPRANLIPAITENELDETVAAWRTIAITPSELGADPLDGLAKVLCAPGALPELRTNPTTPADLAKGPRLTVTLKFKEAIAAASREQKGGVRLLVLVDQLEESCSSPTFTEDTPSLPY